MQMKDNEHLKDLGPTQQYDAFWVFNYNIIGNIH